MAQRDPESAAEPAVSVWWGSYDLDPGQVGHWRIESLGLWIKRAEREWQIARTTVVEDEVDDWEFDPAATMPDETEELERHVFTKTRGPLHLMPALADRPVVASPRMPVYVSPGEKVTLHVGSPVWVHVEVGSPARALLDAPVRRPSDTWFGPSTREGELCYATRTRAVLDPSNLPSLAGRAITPIAIENHGVETLPVERIKLPVPFLSLHAGASGQLWTPTVTMVGQHETGMASFTVGKKPPSHIGAHELSPPREKSEPGLLIRAFSLFRSHSSGD